MDSYRLVLETEAESESEAVRNLQQIMRDMSLAPDDIRVSINISMGKVGDKDDTR